MQDGPPADVDDILLGNAHHAREPDRHFRDTAGVPLRLLIPQFQRARPAFQCGFVRQTQLSIGVLQPSEQVVVVNGNGRLAREGLQE